MTDAAYEERYCAYLDILGFADLMADLRSGNVKFEATRGLMELVILDIGLDIKVISPALFSMMVVMALVTTFMATPLLSWFCPDRILLETSRRIPAPEPAIGTLISPSAERISA